MKFFVGTSGYSYKEWKGSFYPEKLPQKEMLSYYAERFSTVEINNTFYRLPTEAVVESWAQQVPQSFRFVLKARQVITHFKRLQNAEKETDDFLRIASVLTGTAGANPVSVAAKFQEGRAAAGCLFEILWRPGQGGGRVPARKLVRRGNVSTACERTRLPCALPMRMICRT